ncbi:MAG: fatty acid desaturase [Deltaproteobacteria bacterium]|nr:MAG: fatty acid desaturase [Deltaproteobacteria bacterium]
MRRRRRRERGRRVDTGESPSSPRGLHQIGPARYPGHRPSGTGRIPGAARREVEVVGQRHGAQGGSGASASPRDFVRRSDLRGALALLRDWGLIFATAFVAEHIGTAWARAAAVLLIGRIQFGIGEALLHEASHHNLFRTRRLNDALQVLYALPFFVTLQAWRAEHLRHHRLLGEPGDHIVDDYGHYGLLDPQPRLRWIWFGRPLCGLVAFDYLRGLFEINRPRDWAVVAGTWAIVLGAGTIGGHLELVLLYHVLPQLLVFAPLLYWSEIADHYRTRTGCRSRTGALANWFGHDNGYHEIHHRYETIPFHQLRAAHRALLGDDAETATGWWSVWRQVSRPDEPVPERWRRFWPGGA